MANIKTRKEIPPENSLLDKVMRLRQCCERLQAGVGKASRLSVTQCSVLQLIPPQGGIPVGELCRSMGLSASRGGRVIEELVQAGLLERLNDASDRRVNRVALSATGAAQQQQLLTHLAACEAGILKGLSPEEHRAVQAGLDLALRAMEKL